MPQPQKQTAQHGTEPRRACLQDQMVRDMLSSFYACDSHHITPVLRWHVGSQGQLI